MYSQSCTVVALGHMCTFPGDSVMVMGGFYEQHSADVEEYNVRTRAWSRIAPMLHARSAGAACLCDQRPMVMGGIGVDGVMSKAERYHSGKGVWMPVADMLTRRAFCACAELNGRVIVIGGCDQDFNKLNTVEQYCPVENAWYFLPSMNTRRQGCSAVVLEGKLIVMGGMLLLWYGVVWCGVVWCGVVWCGVVWCGVVWFGVVWFGVVWRGVVWCGVVWCGVVWCGVVWWVQVNGRAVCVACAMCASVFHVAEGGNGETWRPPTRPWLLAQEFPRDSLPLRRSVRAQPGLQQRGTRLGVGVPYPDGLLDDAAHEFCPQCMGPGAVWAHCMEGVRTAAAHCPRTAGSHSWLRTGAAWRPTLQSSHVASR